MALYPLLRPVAFALDPERAHRLTIKALRMKRTGSPPAPDPVLATTVAGLRFPNPVGLAAGFDKDAEVPDPMLGLGFGFVEVGTVTPRPQRGNPKPRLFRLREDEAAINRLGFNNRGQAAAAARLESRAGRRRALGRGGPAGIVGVNIGANKDSVASDSALLDYAEGVRAMRGVADYLTINISSPNTPGLRALQGAEALDELLAAVLEARGEGPPVLLKVAPDLDPADIDDIVTVSVDRKIDALIIGNTTISRPPLRSRHREETGGLSGAPLKALALQRLKDFRAATGGTLPLIAAGGIASGADAYERIRAGASLVQLYTALVYHGPGLAKQINRELKALLMRDDFATVAAAVG